MPVTRINDKFSQLQKEGRAAFIPYIMAYDPDRVISQNILNQLPACGADIIELGMPFSDPMADGPAIAAAGSRALKQGATLQGILEMVAEFRKNDHVTGLILMGYYNPVLHYGVEQFAKDASIAGVDGLLIVDTPIEEDQPLVEACQHYDLAMIKLVTPTTPPQRLEAIIKKASGFLYYVTIAGITGTKSAKIDDVHQAVKKIKQKTPLPVAAGFGIRTPQDVKAMGKGVDGVVVGSAIVKEIAALQNKQQILKNISNFIKILTH